MERKIVERRTVLKGGVAAVGILGGGASSEMTSSVDRALADTPQSALPDQILTAVQRFRETIPPNFDRDYVEKVVIPFFLTSFYEGERPMLPMIGVNFSKENALPYDLWGLITRDWRPTPEQGVTVFLQGLEKRGPNNLRKRIYFSAVTPDLYKPMYSAKEKTIAWYWLKNAGDGSHFAKKDVVFECFHNFVALSQWGNSIFGIMSRLSEDGGDPAVRASFQKTMNGNFDNASGAPFTPLELFVMELFRVISPNGGSISAIKDARTSAYGASPQERFGFPLERHSYISSPHTSTSLDPVHWKNPDVFDPTRYLGVPTSAQITEDKCRQIGLARCPFDITNFEVKDGRKANITNSGFGTVFGVADGKNLPVCDYAGFAPFGFGYRRCPGEQLTINVFEDFLRKVWRDKIAFRKLSLPNPGQVPIGPNAVIEDDLGFTKSV